MASTNPIIMFFEHLTFLINRDGFLVIGLSILLSPLIFCVLSLVSLLPFRSSFIDFAKDAIEDATENVDSYEAALLLLLSAGLWWLIVTTLLVLLSRAFYRPETTTPLTTTQVQLSTDATSPINNTPASSSSHSDTEDDEPVITHVTTYKSTFIFRGTINNLIIGGHSEGGELVREDGAVERRSYVGTRRLIEISDDEDEGGSSGEHGGGEEE